MAVALREPRHQRRQVLGDAVGVGFVVGVQHPGDAGHPCRRLGHGARARARDQQVHLLAQRAARRDRVEARPLQLRIVVLGEYEDAHPLTLTR